MLLGIYLTDAVVMVNPIMAASRLISGIYLQNIHTLAAKFQVLRLTHKALDHLGLCYLAECVTPRSTTHPACTSFINPECCLKVATPREARKPPTIDRAFLVVATSLRN